MHLVLVLATPSYVMNHGAAGFVSQSIDKLSSVSWLSNSAARLVWGEGVSSFFSLFLLDFLIYS